MNKYFKPFQNVTDSIKGVLIGQSNSLELKQSATKVKESVQPCFQELRQSAGRLQELIQVCFHELEHTEDVWHSKPRIAAASKLEIWQQLGEISGCAFRIRLLKYRCKSEAIKKAQESWNRRFELLKRAWFIDDTSGKNQDVSKWDKDQLIQDIILNLDWQARDLNLILQENLKLIYQELETINLEKIKAYVSLLDRKVKANLVAQINPNASEIEDKFSNLGKNLPVSAKEFSDSFNPALENFAKLGSRRSIGLEQFAELSKNYVLANMENAINSVLDDRVQLATQVLEQAIAFYNDFLERQERYQQETPEQRQTEKVWIDKQHWELTQVQHNIEAILNSSGIAENATVDCRWNQSASGVIPRLIAKVNLSRLGNF